MELYADNMCSFYLTQFIQLIHVLIVFYFVITPFITNNKQRLLEYIVLTTFLIFHWITNNDTCALTQIESFITNKHENETFIGKIIKPVYNISDLEIYIVMLLLLLFSLYKFYFK